MFTLQVFNQASGQIRSGFPLEIVGAAEWVQVCETGPVQDFDIQYTELPPVSVCVGVSTPNQLSQSEAVSAGLWPSWTRVGLPLI